MDWILYDTMDLSTSATTWIEFFAQNEQSDGWAETNLKQANQLPVNEDFRIEEIWITSTPDIATNDVYELMEEAIIEVSINGNRKLIFPALLAGAPFHQYLCLEDATDATAAGTAMPAGSGYKLKVPIVIKGGQPFKVRFRTGATAAGAGDSFIVMLRGTRRIQ